MFKLKITGIVEAKLFSWWATHTISLVSIPFENNGRNHLVIHMSDVKKPNLKRTEPTRNHIDQILNYTKNLNDKDKLLIHCHQGISRSTAVAIGIAIQHGLAISDAFEYIRKIRPVMIPNTLILNLFDEALNLNGKLKDYSENWFPPPETK